MTLHSFALFMEGLPTISCFICQALVAFEGGLGGNGLIQDALRVKGAIAFSYGFSSNLLIYSA